MKKRNYIFIAFGAGFAIITLFLAFQLAPWFYAINTRVKLYMDAPAETEIDICWDEQLIECLPLVPYSEVSNSLVKPGEVASIWLSELPPRPVYHVSLVFKTGVHGAIFHELELDSSTIQILGVLPGAGVGNIQVNADQFIANEISSKLINGVYSIESDIDGKLTLPKQIKPTLADTGKIGMTTLTVWLLLFSILLVFIIPFSLLPRTVKNFGISIKHVHPSGYPWWVYFLCCVAAGIMLFLIANSAVIINNYDPLGYLTLATGGGWFNVSRMPGYPLFLGLALWVSSNSLNGVILFQAALLVLSTLLCVWILRRWLHPFAGVLFVFLCIFSPVQVNLARWILRESLFASLVLLGMTALIAHFTSRKPFSEIWLVVYAIICAAAFLVRENGILLPAAMLPVLLVEVIKRLMSPWKISERLRSVFSLFVHYSIPVFAVGLVYIGFGGYNYLHYGYFQIVEPQKSHHFLARTIFSSNFDSRSLLNPMTSMDQEAETYLGWPIYSSFILSRYQAPFSDPIYASLYNSINIEMIKRGQTVNIFHSASVLDEVGINSFSLVPWQADFAALLRHYNALISTNIGTYSLEPDDPTTFANKLKMLNDVSKNLKYSERSADLDGIISGYYDLSLGYKWYGIIFILALISSLYILRYKDAVFLVPITLFLANCFFLIITRYVQPRYSAILDVLLILQIVLGLSFWLNDRNSNIKKLSLSSK